MSLDQEETEKILLRFIQDRKQAAKPGPDFTLKVMESVRGWEAERKAAPAAARNPRRAEGGSWMSRLRAFLDSLAAPGPRMAFASLALFLVAGAAWFVAGRMGPEGDTQATRVKGGGFLLGFQLKRDGKVSPALPGGEFRAGDRLQAVYSAEAPGHIQLFSVDAAGSISCFSCAAPDAELPAGREHALGYALELDASVGTEFMVAFWSPGTAPAGERLELLRDAWKDSGADADRLAAFLAKRLSDGASVSVFPLVKKGGAR